MLQQDYKVFKVRDAAILTGSYVAGTTIGTSVDFPTKGIHLENQLSLYIDFTIGSLTDVLIKLEFSSDDTTYYQETMSSVLAGISTDTLLEHKIAATGKYRLSIPVKDRYVKVSVKGEGTATDSSIAITAVIGIV